MRNKIIMSLLLLFALFLAGAGFTMVYLYHTTTNLQSVINLHKVEIIRQDLVINAQTVQSHLYSFGTVFGQELDVIVDNVITLEEASNKCLTCHHTPEITRRLEEVGSIVDQYQDALSYLITTSANKERVERLRMVAIGIGTNLLDKVQEMAVIAGQKLSDKTYKSLQEINNSRVILIVTLVLSFFIAIAIAVSMTRQITEPIDELLDATRHIKAGELGYTTHYRGQNEFAELINSFNDMSLTLDHSNKEILRHLGSLSNLYSVTLTFHSITNVNEIYRDLANGVADLVGAEQAGLMLLEGEDFMHVYPAVGLDREAARMIRAPKGLIQALYNPSNRRAFMANSNIEESPTWQYDKKLNVRNMLLVWVRHKGELVGAIRVANKKTGPFVNDDIHPLAILANNVSVALENARLYQNLRDQMTELKSAQEQLVQAAKLVAIGELASNVAHELNNPLTTVLGYAELMKEEKSLDNIVSDLEVIERECLRAKDIIRQLLEFARKRSLTVKEVEVNSIVNDVLELARLHMRMNTIKIEKNLGANTTMLGDSNQLKQVFINLVNNAMQAMEQSDGLLSVETASDAESVTVRITDTGTGIAPENLGRIFEPFFSTKKEKGTGIGLSVSYQIVKVHGGTIEVDSKVGKGTTFTVKLPKANPSIGG